MNATDYKANPSFDQTAINETSIIAKFNLAMARFAVYIVVAFWGVCIPTHGLIAQDPTLRFEDVSDSYGIPTSDIIDMLQAKDGTLWMGGLEGLLRFDGHTYDVFNTSADAVVALSGNTITALASDSLGNLLIGTGANGLNVYSNQQKKVIRFTQQFPALSSMLSERIKDIVVDSQNRIWVAGEKGLHIIKFQTDTASVTDFTQIVRDAQCVKADWVPNVLYYNHEKDEIWIGANIGLSIIDLSTNSIKCAPFDDTLPMEFVDDITKDRNGNIWISRKHEHDRLLFLHPDSSSFQSFKGIKINSAQARTHLRFDLSNRMWVSVFSEGLYGYDFAKMRSFIQRKTDHEVLGERFVRRPFVDMDGNVWIPTYGLYKVDFNRGFHTYQHPFTFSQSHTTVLHEKEFMWSAYRDGGIVKLNRANGEVVRFHKEAPIHHRIPSNLVHEIKRLSNGNLAILCFPYLTLLDDRDRVITSIDIKGSSRAIIETKNQSFIIGDKNGLSEYSLDGVFQKSIPFPEKLTQTACRISSFVWKDDALWFGTTGCGVGVLRDNRAIEFYDADETFEWLRSAYVNDLHIDKEEQLWIATNFGLGMLDLAAMDLHVYDVKDGLSDYHICGVVEDGVNNLWLSTYKGLTKFNKENHQSEMFSSSHGLGNVVYYNGDASYFNGNIFFGGKNGLDFFNPRMLGSNNRSLIPILKRVQVNQADIDVSAKQVAGDVINLTYPVNALEIHSYATRYRRAETVQYRYRIDRTVPIWHSLGNQSRLQLTNLSPGEYEVDLQARYPDESWPKESLTLRFHVSTPWYLHPVTWIAFFLFIVGSVWFGIRYREKLIRLRATRKAEIQKKIADLEKKAFLAQMNPHFIFNTMSAIQEYLATGQREAGLRYIAKFGSLLRKLLRMSEMEYIKLDDEIAVLKTYLEFESMRYPGRLTYAIEIAPNLSIKDIAIPVFLIQPHVEQAVQHCLLYSSNAGHVSISFHQVEHFLRVMISDNGNCQDMSQGAAAQDSMTGTAIVGERLKYINKNIGHQRIDKHIVRDDQGNKIGTRVEILIDINQAL